jgi:hypothetical protein
VHDVSVYGTVSGFRGRAYPGDSFTADAAGEYSVTRNWVLALDIVYQYNGSTRVSGSQPSAAGAPGVTDVRARSGSGYSLGLAPAIEYNWNSSVGLLVGVRTFVAGRNATASVTPAIALNMVY